MELSTVFSVLSSSPSTRIWERSQHNSTVICGLIFPLHIRYLNKCRSRDNAVSHSFNAAHAYGLGVFLKSTWLFFGLGFPTKVLPVGTEFLIYFFVSSMLILEICEFLEMQVKQSMLNIMTWHRQNYCKYGLGFRSLISAKKNLWYLSNSVWDSLTCFFEMTDILGLGKVIHLVTSYMAFISPAVQYHCQVLTFSAVWDLVNCIFSWGLHLWDYLSLVIWGYFRLELF